MKTKLAVAAAFIALIVLFFAFDLSQFLSLEYFSSQKQNIVDYQTEHPWQVAGGFFALYVAVTALSLPGAAIMTLIAGALFGLGMGLLLVSFASTIGASLAFLLARTVLGAWVQSKFAGQLTSINNGIEKDGAFYLFTLRLVPVVPFFVINLAMGLTKIRLWTFYWVSQLGMLAGTAVYVNAGTQLAAIENLSSILSPTLIGSFVLLGLFPWIAKWLSASIKGRRALANFKKPKVFDTNLLVIGAGSAGLVSAYIAAAVKAKVTLIEKHKMGGDCLNTGCVPSKAIIRSGRINHYFERAGDFGLEVDGHRVNFKAVMQRVQQVIATIEPHDSVERYTSLGVDCVQGEATIISPWEVKVGNQVMSAKNIIVATGGRPLIPVIDGIDKIDYLTSDTIWDIDEQPKHLLVIGGGPIGCELAQAFKRLGSDVTMVIRNQLLPKEDADVVAEVRAQLERDGIALLTDHKPLSFGSNEQGDYLMVKHGDQEKTLQFDKVLVAAGRQANTENIGLENVGINRNPNGTVAVDEFLRTDCPTIFACGDVAGPYQFTHVAAHQAWYAAVNSLFGDFKKFAVDYRVIPWVTFTDPEVARVGLSEREAMEQGIEYEITRYDIDDLDRAIADSEAHGFVKVLTVPGKDKILGVTIVGYHASELIAEYILAMKYNLGLNKILGTIHIYPTLNEANKYAAGLWKNAHKPEGLLEWVAKFHQWRRS